MRAVLFLLAMVAVHTVRPDEIAENVRLLQNGMNQFGFELYKKVSQSSNSNVVISAHGVHMVLAMMRLGSNRNTFRELSQVLHFSTGVVEFKRSVAIQEMIQNLEMLGPVLKMSNEVVVNSQVSLRDQFKELLLIIFKSSVKQVDFRDAQTAAQQINAWSAASTGGKIKRIVEPDDLSSGIMLILLNAIQFNGKWNRPFPSENTSVRPFRVTETLTKQVETIHQQSRFKSGFLREMDAEYVIVPYEEQGVQGKRTYMYLIKPMSVDGLATIERNLEYLNIQQLHQRPLAIIRLTIPKFNITNKLDLKDHLEEMGLRTIFTHADFDPMAYGPGNIHVSQVMQKAMISVHEEGTEAAAVTFSDAVFHSSQQPYHFNIDRPFFFMLGTEDLVFFIGKVLDPTH